MWSGWATLRVAIIAAVVPFAKLANTRSVNHLEGKLLVIIKVVEDHGVGFGEGLSLRGLKSSQDDGLEDGFDINVVTEEGEHLQSVRDIAKMTIDVGLGTAVPGHKVAIFGRKQDSLHALVVKWECSEQSFPYLLATEFCVGTVFGEHDEGIGAVTPKGLKSAVEQGLQDVTVVRIQSHPCVLLLVVHELCSCGDKRAAAAEAGQHPTELETEDVEKEVDVARKVLVPMHATLAESVVSGEVGFLP
jgi:hypothetical protein